VKSDFERKEKQKASERMGEIKGKRDAKSLAPFLTQKRPN